MIQPTAGPVHGVSSIPGMTELPYIERQNLLRQRLEREGLTHFLVSSLPNVRYLCGFSGTHALLLIGLERNVIVSDGRYAEQIQSEVVGAELELQGRRKDSETIGDVLSNASGLKLGFEGQHTSVERHKNLVGLSSDHEWISRVNWVEDLRIRKDASEVALLCESLQLAEAAFEEVLPEIRAGMTERELAHRLEDLMWQAGAEKESFETLVLFGSRSSLPHGKPSDFKLVEGMPVLMDFGCLWKGYCSDITRTVFLGDPGAEFRDAYRVVRDANLAACEAIHAGLTCRDADAAARSVIDNAGRGDLFIHSLGHGVGLEVHEMPRLAPTEEGLLEQGMVVTIEPGIYVPDWGGIRIENMVVITDDSCDVLNRTSTEMTLL